MKIVFIQREIIGSFNSEVKAAAPHVAPRRGVPICRTVPEDLCPEPLIRYER